MMGLSTYVPLYAQSVLGYGAVVSGFALAAMTLGWPIAASNSGRLYLTIGFRATMLIGGAIAAVGTALLLLDRRRTARSWLLALPCFVMGLGFGLVASPSIIAAQTSVTWQHRGVATGSTMFARSVGSARRRRVFGAIVNHEVAHAARPRRARRLEPDRRASSTRPSTTSSSPRRSSRVALLGVGLLMPKRISEPDEPPGSS